MGIIPLDFDEYQVIVTNFEQKSQVFVPMNVIGYLYSPNCAFTAGIMNETVKPIAE